MKKLLNEREAATLALKDIMTKGAYSNEALRRILSEQGHFERLQKAFVTEIVAGSVRNLFFIDHIINSFSKTPINRIKPSILSILRVAVYQLKFMDKVPHHAAINEAVEIAKKQGFGGLSGYVNGLLRNIARSDIPTPKELHLRYSVQPWIVEHFVRELGDDKTGALLESIMQPPTITVAANTLKTTADALIEILEKEGVTAQAATLPNAVSISKTSDITALKSFKDGLYHVMDEAAMLSIICANPPKNTRIIDLCAAPGGKSFLAAYMAGEGASIISNDIHAHKIKLLEQGAKRLGLANLKVSLHDARIYRPELLETADLLIVDAPCSGLGTLRKRPDIKLNKQVDSMESLAVLTREIIENSWQYVKKGGKMLFSTCTISDVENIDNFNWIMENLPFKPVDFSAHMPINHPTAKDGYAQILPQDFNSDGFFISILERSHQEEICKNLI